MRMILLIVFIIVGMFSVLGFFNYYNNKEEIKEKDDSHKPLEARIKVPEGLEREYAMILKGESPFNLKNEDTSNRTTSNDIEKSINKEEKINFKDQKDIPMPEDTNEKKDMSNKKGINKIQHEYIKTNIKDYGIRNDSLMVDILLFNNTESNISGFGRITCTAYDNTFKPVDQFKWSGNIAIKAKKAILLKDTNFGYAGLNSIAEVWCYVDNFKHNYKEESSFK